MNGFQAAGAMPHLIALGEARSVLNDRGLGCIESVNTAWELLKNVCVEELPQWLRGEWAAISERATNLAALGSGSLGLGVADEAGDIGSIFLCVGWLTHPNRASLIARALFDNPELVLDFRR